MVHDETTTRFPNTYDNFFLQNDLRYEEEHSLEDLLLEDLNPLAKQLFDILSPANNPLYSMCKTYTQMSIIRE